MLLTHKTTKSKVKIMDLKKLDIGTFMWKLKALRKNSRGRVISSSREINNDFSNNPGDPDETTPSKVKVISSSIQVVAE